MLDVVGSKQTVILGDTEGSPVAIVFTATFPERVTALALVNPFARWVRADDYAIGMPTATHDRMIEEFEKFYGQDADMLFLTAPSMAADARFRSWLTRYQRLSMPPGYGASMFRWVTGLDVRHVLPTIQVPTLVVDRAEATHHRVEFGRYIAQNIPDAKYVELAGADTYPFHAGEFGDLLDVVEEFFTGEKRAAPTDRMLSTVLFTDIVASTDKAAQAGDDTWVDLLEEHDRVTAQHVERFRGQVVNHTGDGVVATFDGPTRAVTCGLQLTQAVRHLGIDIRSGLHTGEIEHRNDHVAGIAVHIASRVMSLAPDGGVAVSSTVKDLVTGSGFSFVETGAHQLKGVPGEWAIYEVGADR